MKNARLKGAPGACLRSLPTKAAKRKDLRKFSLKHPACGARGGENLRQASARLNRLYDTTNRRRMHPPERKKPHFFA